MKIEWLYEAKQDFSTLLLYHRNTVGRQSARKFSKKILDAVNQLKAFPEMGVSKTGSLMEKYQFRALFIDKYACIYRVDHNVVYIYHLVDARTNYIYNIFGLKE